MVLIDNLISYYKLDESSGDAIDAHGSDDGTVTGATQNVSGKINTAYSFDGNDLVELNSSISGDTSVTATCWFKTSSSTGFQAILDLNNDGGSSTKGFAIEFDGADGVIQPLIDGIARGSGSTVINDGTWHFAVITRNGNDYNVYLDGGSTPEATLTNAGGSFGAVNRIGQNGHASIDGFFIGEVDEVGIWSRVLSTSEMSELYNSGNGLAYPFVSYELTTTASPIAGGSITGAGEYPENEVVPVEATANDGYFFYNWTGDLTGSTNPDSITMDTDKSITANFKAIGLHFTSGQIAESTPIDLNNGTITGATLTSTEESGSFDYEMTANGDDVSPTWDTVTNNTPHTFTVPGEDLRWRATENAASTGEISKIIVEEYH